jgi:hypothetical protein
MDIQTDLTRSRTIYDEHLDLNLTKFRVIYYEHSDLILQGFGRYIMNIQI